MTMLKTVTAGFLPLTDSMILIAAREKGFAKANGVDLILSKELSWATIRDRITVGHLDVAHMLAPMPIAMNAGLVPFSAPMVVPMALGLGGNAITLQKDIWENISDKENNNDVDALANGETLKQHVVQRLKSGQQKLRFGVVHPFSGHNLELRYWLSSCGINPEEDIEIVIVPPPLMPDALASGQIDGFCVGEPWNSVCVSKGHGRIITTKSEVWKSSPEKVLGVRAEWAEENQQTLSSLVRALHKAAKWCGDRSNRPELAAILSKAEYINISKEIILHGLEGTITPSKGNTIMLKDFMVPFDRAANFPWQSHALWFYSQMVRWGQIPHTAKNMELAKNAYRPDLFRSALKDSDAAIPSANMKVEGALRQETAVGSTGRLMLGPDGFFDGKTFDPDKVEDYIASFAKYI